MASDPIVENPDTSSITTTTIATVEKKVQVVEEQQQNPIISALDRLAVVINRIDGKVSAVPTQEQLQQQWQIQLDLQRQLRERWQMEEDSRGLLRAHIQDMAEMRKQQAVSNEKTEKLSVAQDRLADALENINDSLKSGFELGSNVVKLFGKITLVFLAVVFALSLVIVWIAKMDISKDGGKFNIRSGLPPAAQPAIQPANPE